MNSSWSTSIEKLMFWRAGNWCKHNSKTTKWKLRITYDVLFITDDTRIFESLNLHSKIKGIYKEDIFILIVSGLNNEIWKIKFQIKHNVAECVEMLGQHFPVVKHNSAAPEKIFQSRYRNIEEVMKIASQKIGITGSLPLPPELNNFVKLCLLDPSMPQIINNTQKILEDLQKS